MTKKHKKRAREFNVSNKKWISLVTATADNVNRE